MIIEGGKELKGEVKLQGAKNGALQAIIVALITDETVILTNVPSIRDIETNLGVLTSMGAEVFWDKKDDSKLSINCSKVKNTDIDPTIAQKTTGSKYFIPILVQKFGEVITGVSGGDKIGGHDRYQLGDNIIKTYKEMGIEVESLADDRYRFYKAQNIVNELKLKERYFGPTIQALLGKSFGDGKEFTIVNPNIEPEIFETISLLKKMGADIKYQENGIEKGEDRIIIKPVKKLHGMEHRIISDPNALVSYAVMALITNGEIRITDVDPTDKVEAFLRILDGMRAIYNYEIGPPLESGKRKAIITLKPSLNKLRSINLKTGFWPAQCHTDWQQLFTPLLSIAKGVSMIDENYYPERFTSVEELTKMGGEFELINDSERIDRPEYKTDGKPHTLKIIGGKIFKPANIKADKDIRGATGLLAAALSAKGISTINTAQIDRGLENLRETLISMGVKILN